MTGIATVGSDLLYRAASGFERALADTGAPRILQIEAELIIDVWDPYRIAHRNLPFLAWAMGVLLWEDGWTEETQREWTAQQWKFKSIRGSPAAIKMAVDFVGRDFVEGSVGGYDVLQIVAPPQGFYASPNMTKEEWDTWVHLMPEIRIKFANRQGTSPGDVWYSDDGCVGLSAPYIDLGPTTYGREAVIRYPDGREVDLLYFHIETTVEQQIATDFERYVIPGKSRFGIFAGDVFSDDGFVDAADVEPQLVSARLNRSYNHETSILHLSSIMPGLEPLTVNYERNSDVGNGGWLFFAGDFAQLKNSPPWSYAGKDPAAELLADRVFLHDPSVAVPMLTGVSFAGYDRVGMTRYTAEMLIDLHTTATGFEWFAEESAPGAVLYSTAMATDVDDIDRALRAVVAGKALRDTVLVTFAVTRPLQAGDVVTSDHIKVHEYVPTML